MDKYSTYAILNTDPETSEFTSAEDVWCAVFGLLWLGLVATDDRFAVTPTAKEYLNDWLTVMWSASQGQMGIIGGADLEVDDAIVEWIPVVFQSVRCVDFYKSNRKKHVFSINKSVYIIAQIIGMYAASSKRVDIVVVHAFSVQCYNFDIECIMC